MRTLGIDSLGPHLNLMVDAKTFHPNEVVFTDVGG